QIRCQLIRLPLSLTRLPYTTLFRSRLGRAREQAAAGERRCEPAQRDQDQGAAGGAEQTQRVDLQQRGLAHALSAGEADPQPRPRSEEHTSELQSRENLVCRLLLEKK